MVIQNVLGIPRLDGIYLHLGDVLSPHVLDVILYVLNAISGFYLDFCDVLILRVSGAIPYGLGGCYFPGITYISFLNATCMYVLSV